MFSQLSENPNEVRGQASISDTRLHYERFGGPGGGPRPPLAPETLNPLPNRKVVVPMIFPVLGEVRWHDSYNENRGTFRHTGIDIDAPKMRPVVAPFSGILGFKTQTFWIFGDNDYKCLGTHLNDDTPGTDDNKANPDYMFAPNLRPGDHVIAGQLIGYVGNSGFATGPHLHFELFTPDRVLVSPLPSLKAATHISEPRAVLTSAAIRIGPSETRIDGCFRSWDPIHLTITLLLVVRQPAGGNAVAYTTPTWYRLALPPSAVGAAGGAKALTSLVRDRALSFTVASGASAKPKSVAAQPGGTARLFTLPVGGPLSGSISAGVLPGQSADTSGGRLGSDAGETTWKQAADMVFADFERGTYDRWMLEGDCWGDGPDSGTTFGGTIRGYQGKYFLCSFHPKRGGAAMGRAVSTEFVIKRRFINFLIGGGRFPGVTCMNLLIDGVAVRSETGNNRRTLEQASWDVTNLIGKRARIEILDRSTVADLGYIMIDQIRFEARPRPEAH